MASSSDGYPVAPSIPLVQFERVRLGGPGGSSGPRAAVITLLGSGNETFGWGTPVREHRLNPFLVGELNAALDAALAPPTDGGERCGCVLVTGEGKFWSNGLDLKYLDALQARGAGGWRDVDSAVDKVNALMARLLRFPVPTICVANGHWCAAGGMLGLTFDFRVMSNDRGFFFIPGVDLGLQYSPFQLALMMAKLPVALHRDVIVLNRKRWTADELQAIAVVDAGAPKDRLLAAALEFAAPISRPGTAVAQAALEGIKAQVHAPIINVLGTLGGGKMDLYSNRDVGRDKAAPPPLQAKL